MKDLIENVLSLLLRQDFSIVDCWWNAHKNIWKFVINEFIAIFQLKESWDMIWVCRKLPARELYYLHFGLLFSENIMDHDDNDEMYNEMIAPPCMSRLVFWHSRFALILSPGAFPLSNSIVRWLSTYIYRWNLKPRH